MPRCKVDRTIDEGDDLTIGDRTLEVWSTPGHTAGQLAFRMGDLLFSGDNIFRDGCVGVIDAHHGSNLVDFIASLKRIRDCDVEYLLPSHGPIFRKDDALLDATIARLESLHPHGRLRHLRRRLAAAGPVGGRAGARASSTSRPDAPEAAIGPQLRPVRGNMGEGGAVEWPSSSNVAVVAGCSMPPTGPRASGSDASAERSFAWPRRPPAGQPSSRVLVAARSR